MPLSPYIKQLREKIGHDLLVFPSSSVIIFREDGRFALLRVAGTDQWMMAGGFVEPYEHPADSAVREAWEEIGMRIKPYNSGTMGPSAATALTERDGRTWYE